jgi:cytochrome c oxidase assembly factor CtaG
MILLHTGHGHLPQANSFVDFLRHWNYSPEVVIPLGAMLGLYLVGRGRLMDRAKYPTRAGGRTALFLLGFGALALALISPIERFTQDLFFMHMVQHLLLTMVAAPLLLLSAPVAEYMWALPDPVRLSVGQWLNRRGFIRQALKGVTLPVVAWLTFGVVMWSWHVPEAYNAALNSWPVHIIEHMTMFGAAVIFWWPVIGPAPLRTQLPYPLRFLYLFLAMFQSIILGAILTFATDTVYSYYESAPTHFGISKSNDQQLAGILMWLPGSFVHLTALLTLLYLWLDREERQKEREKRAEALRSEYVSQRAQAAESRGE